MPVYECAVCACSCRWANLVAHKRTQTHTHTHTHPHAQTLTQTHTDPHPHTRSSHLQTNTHTYTHTHTHTLFPDTIQPLPLYQIWRESSGLTAAPPHRPFPHDVTQFASITARPGSAFYPCQAPAGFSAELSLLSDPPSHRVRHALCPCTKQWRCVVAHPLFTPRVPAHRAQFFRYSAPCASTRLGLEPTAIMVVHSVNTTIDKRESHFGAL